MKPLVCCQLLAAAMLIAAPTVSAETVWQVQHLENLDYPLVSVNAGQQGTFLITCRLNQTGEVLGAEVAERSGPKYKGSPIETAALQNALKWRFLWANEDEAPTRFTVTLKYIFLLEGECRDRLCPTRFSFDMPNIVTVLNRFRPL